MITEQISIVIVESQPIMRTALSTAISAEGLNVVAEVSESADVLQIASRLDPDLILFSVGSPSLKDLQRISVLRREIPSALILALVTGEFSGQEQSALDYGAHTVLTRLTPRWELLRAIKKLVAGKFQTAIL